MNRRCGRGLTEVWIVVTLLGALGAATAPMLQRQSTNRRVATAHDRMRAVSVALEAYVADQAGYPPNPMDGNHFLALLPDLLTTPVAYTSAETIEDPFSLTSLTVAPQPRLVYVSVWHFRELHGHLLGPTGVPYRAVDETVSGAWHLSSVGPDMSYGPLVVTRGGPNVPIPYDPTNGAVSAGDIVRSQFDPSGRTITTDALANSGIRWEDAEIIERAEPVFEIRRP